MPEEVQPQDPAEGSVAEPPPEVLTYLDPASDADKETFKEALIQAGHYFNIYNQESVRYKKQFLGVRQMLIAIPVLISLLAVINTTAGFGKFGALFIVLGCLSIMFIGLGLLFRAYTPLLWALRSFTSYWDARIDAEEEDEPSGRIERFLQGVRGTSRSAVDPEDTTETTPAFFLKNFRLAVWQMLRFALLGILVFSVGAYLFLQTPTADAIANEMAQSGAFIIDEAADPPAEEVTEEVTQEAATNLERSFRIILTLLLIILPLLSSGLLEFAALFMRTEEWTAYRMAAESLRAKIYTLRCQYHYGKLTKEELETLDDAISDIKKAYFYDSGVTAHVGTEGAELDKPAKATWIGKKEDDGYAPLALEAYYMYRVEPQMNWYHKQIRNNRNQSRLFRATVIALGGFGALFTALNFGEFTAVTAALSTAMLAWLGFVRFEQRSRNYDRTLWELGRYLTDYMQDKTDDESMAVITATEAILVQEREAWHENNIQAKDILEDVRTTYSDDDDNGDDNGSN